MNRIKAKDIVTIGSLLVIGSFAAAMAYFTSSDAVTNRFTAGNVSLELTEPRYADLSKQEKILASKQKLPKDPQITNTGKNAEIVFIEVYAPLYQSGSFTLLDDSGAKLTAGTDYSVPFQVFDFRSDCKTNETVLTLTNNKDTTTFEYSKDWVLLEQKQSGNTYYYRFGYTYVLAPDATTATRKRRPQR